MNPFDTLNQHIKQNNDVMSKREFFALHIYCASISADDPMIFDDVIKITDGLLEALKDEKSK